ncbi:MAG: class I SAM-dependent methyltransferase [Woeseia sp.]|jgi:SAM-dependent methyltransferase
MSGKNTAMSNDNTTMAERADIHELYEQSVQNVEHEIEFLQNTFREIRGRNAYLLREDFCGTASASCQWVKQGKKFQAIGVDIEPSVLDWGREHRVGKLPAADRARVSLIESDVLTADTPPVDVLVAFNFSYFIFQQRATMLEYFKRAYAGLKDDGVFFVDLFGGPESQEETKEKTKFKKLGFTYVWHQQEFHPVTNRIRCAIHFHFKDGSKLKNAFTYDWRLYSAPEIKDLLIEAGFRKATVYWEGEDEDGDGNGEFTPSDRGEADLAWIAYIVAEK